MRRSLSLKRESLAALSSGEMASVAGGSHACTVTHGPSIDQACPTPTLPVAICVADATYNYCITISPQWCVWDTLV